MPGQRCWCAYSRVLEAVWRHIGGAWRKLSQCPMKAGCISMPELSDLKVPGHKHAILYILLSSSNNKS
eukprot:5701356-Amphidinium_carterae.1